MTWVSTWTSGICAVGVLTLGVCVRGVEEAAPLAVRVDATSITTRPHAPHTMIGIETETTGHSVVGGGLSSQMLVDGSFEDPKDDPALPPAVNSTPPCSSTCHWSFGPNSTIAKGVGYDGNRSAFLAAGARVSSAGLYSRGLGLAPNEKFSGYFFIHVPEDSIPKKNLRASPIQEIDPAKASAAAGGRLDVTVGLSLDCAAAHPTGPRQSYPAASLFSSQTPRGDHAKWAMVNFTLTYTGPSPTARGCFYIESSPAAATVVYVDRVFLQSETKLWNDSSMKVRGDVADSLVLTDPKSNRRLLQAVRWNGGMAHDPNYVWKNFRGPTWLRPCATGTGQWYKYQEYSFAMFEMLELAERAGLGLVVLGLNVWHETPTSAGQLVEYLFGDASTHYGSLRISDGHPMPYNASTLVVELGNEEVDPGYWAVAGPILRAMRNASLALAASGTAADGQDLTGLRWSVMYCAWGLAHCNASIVAAIAEDTADLAESMLWDQHDGAVKTNWADIGFQAQAEMLALLRRHGWNQSLPLVVGETNCGPEAMDVCSSLNRALVYGLYIADALRSGTVLSVMPAVWGYASCTPDGLVCGGGDGDTAWLQPELVLTPTTVLRQPSWYAHRLIAANWGDRVLGVTPNRSTDPNDPTGILDVLAMATESGESVTIHVTHARATSRTLDLTVDFGAGSAACDGAIQAEVLWGSNVSAYNTLDKPTTVVPTVMAVTVRGGVATVSLPPYSLSVFTLPKCRDERPSLSDSIGER